MKKFNKYVEKRKVQLLLEYHQLKSIIQETFNSNQLNQQKNYLVTEFLHIFTPK